jgi:arylsulfatase A-like enzyme
MRRFARLGFMVLLGASAATFPAAAQRPNVVLIIADDQAYGDYGFMGHPTVRTPHLDRLAAGGAVFTRGYVTSSLCRPSLATILTGLYPHQHRITCNDPPDDLSPPQRLVQRAEQIAYIERVPTLARQLSKQGYLCFQSGKWWEGDYRRGGFTHGMTHGDPQRGGRHGDEGLAIGRQGLQPIFDFLDATGGKPFFLWYAPMLPHEPHNPPEKYLAHYRNSVKSIHVARYYAMIEWFDQTCGDLLAYLDRKKLADNTLVVFLADNGWIQQPDARGFAPRSKRSPYEGGLRTPVVLRWPKRIAPSRDAQSLVSSIDLAPTILRACNLPPTTGMQGVDLRRREALAAREAVFGEVFGHSAVDVHRPKANLQYRWCIRGHWKLIDPEPSNVPGGRPELYDLAVDPAERGNLASDRPETVAQLRSLLDGWWPNQ